MKINCCLIVKDDTELTSLKRAVASVKPYVEGVYITANGKDVEGIESYCREEGLHYSYLPWNDDFSEQRNFNFNQAPQDSDYLFWMDADDVLVGGTHLQTVAELGKNNHHDLIFLTYWYACQFNGDPSIETLIDVEMEHMRERLIRPGTQVWKARLHETPVPVSGVRNQYTQYPYHPERSPMAVMHTANLSKAKHNTERNKRILELQLAEEKAKGEADPRTELYLMKIYAEDESTENAERVFELGESYLKKSGWDEERGNCYEQMAIVSERTGDYKKAIELLHRGIAEWPTQPLLYIRLARNYYNIKNYRAARHWAEVAGGLDLESKTGGLKNLKAMKILFAELLLKLSYNVDKSTEKSVEAANLLYQVDPTKENKEQLLYMQDVNDLNEACKNTHQLAKYLKSIDKSNTIIKLLDVLPPAIVEQQMFLKIRREVAPPRKWRRNEICYFANFGGKHFEKWDATSLEKGIGGSETAVIRLSQKWTEMGYKVTIYGDPMTKGDHNGVTYLPWYYFNYKDSFNIFIQWRSWALASQVKARKFYVDLHDIYSGVDISKEDMEHIDSFMVKSEYHRSLAPNIPDDKFSVISNAI